MQIFRHRLFEESGERRIGSLSTLLVLDVIIRVTIDNDRKRERKIRSKICYRMGVITSQVSIRRIKEERLFLSPLSRNNHTFHSRGITLSSSEFVCIKTRMGLNIRVNSFVNGALTENLKEWSLNRLESQVQFLASITVHIVNE